MKAVFLFKVNTVSITEHGGPGNTPLGCGHSKPSLGSLLFRVNGKQRAELGSQLQQVLQSLISKPDDFQSVSACPLQRRKNNMAVTVKQKSSHPGNPFLFDPLGVNDNSRK